MPADRPMRAGRRALAAAIAAVVLGSACLPSTWVARHAPPPPDVAREEEARSAASPIPAEPAATPPATPRPPPAAPRSLAEILDLALSRDPATRAAWFDARAAAARAGATTATQWLPAIDITGTLVRQRIGASPIRPTPFFDTTVTPAASLNWLILDAGVRSALVQQADLLAAAARYAEVSAVASLVLSVQQAYFGYLGARALVEAETATVKQAETSLAAAEARQRAGLATVADVLQARTALSQARLTLQQYQGQALAERGALATLAGLPPTAELDVGSLPADVNTDVAQGRDKEGVGSILDLLNAQAALELALAESIRARADYLFSLAQLARAAGRLDLAAAPAMSAVPKAPAPGAPPPAWETVPAR